MSCRSIVVSVCALLTTVIAGADEQPTVRVVGVDLQLGVTLEEANDAVGERCEFYSRLKNNSFYHLTCDQEGLEAFRKDPPTGVPDDVDGLSFEFDGGRLTEATTDWLRASEDDEDKAVDFADNLLRLLEQEIGSSERPVVLELWRDEQPEWTTRKLTIWIDANRSVEVFFMNDDFSGLRVSLSKNVHANPTD